MLLMSTMPFSLVHVEPATQICLTAINVLVLVIAEHALVGFSLCKIVLALTSVFALSHNVLLAQMAMIVRTAMEDIMPNGRVTHTPANLVIVLAPAAVAPIVQAVMMSII